jgi:hypothetical protein
VFRLTAQVGIIWIKLRESEPDVKTKTRQKATHGITKPTPHPPLQFTQTAVQHIDPNNKS